MRKGLHAWLWPWVLGCVVLAARDVRADGLGDVVTDADSVIRDFSADPAMDWFRDNVKHAKGVLIIPRLWKGGFLFGGSGGSGVLLARDPQTGAWSYPAFYSMGSVTVGPQAGAEASQVVLIILSQRGLDSMMATNAKLGADVEVAAGPVGTGAAAATADILAYSRNKGLFAGASVAGAWLTERASWNQEYYGQPVRPMEILIEKKVANPQADMLREQVAKVSASVPTLTQQSVAARGGEPSHRNDMDAATSSR
jgi:SH3 domain-containing YSC84-like protein 1